MSENGMFLCILQPLEEGSVINISVPSKFAVKAVVRNSQPGIGMGIEFIDLDSDQKIIIKRFIDEKHDASKRSAL